MLAGGAAVYWAYTEWHGNGDTRNTAQPKPQAAAAAPATPVKAPAEASIRENSSPTKKKGGRESPERIAPGSKKGMETNAKTVLTSPDYVPPNPEGTTNKAALSQGLQPKQASAVSYPGPNSSPAAAMRSSDLVPDKSSTPRTSGQSSADADQFALAEVLSKDTLPLQAISWSDIPSERITIIAGQILREGQNVDGYTVIEIRPEDVILEKAGKQWKVVYGGQ